MTLPKKYRVIVAEPCMYGMGKPEVMAAALRDAGFEVIYLDLEQEFRLRLAELDKTDAFVIEIAGQQTCEALVNAALQEDADAVCFGIHPAHLRIYWDLCDLLNKKGLNDVLVLGGSLIHREEAEEFAKQGGGRLFGPGTTTNAIVDYLREELPRRRKTE